MTLLLISFLAGILTVLAPCTLPLLPIIVGRSAGTDHKYRPLVIAGSLALAIVVFTLLLKASTAFINIPQSAWAYISGTIIIVFGLIYLFPTAWETLSIALKFSSGSSELLQKSSQKKGLLGDILVGLSLGPVFSSCSPTYFLILATVLPQSYATGVLYLIAYAIGLSLSLLLIGYLGQRVVKKLKGAADPKGWFKRGLGALFILVGLFIMTGTDKKLQTYILDTGFLDITKVEQALLTEPMADTMDTSTNNISGSGTTKNYPRYKEIAKPAGFVNSDPFQLADLVGKKVILLDIMTYSCINCQRTFPYVNSWYEKYKDAGLAIVGIHTPEFAFEHKKENVEEAAKQFGLTFPLVLDNEYATWNAYGNRYWPRKYLIDIDGNIVYDHIGEGGYEETEKKIQELLRERRERLGETTTIASDIARPEDAETPDTRTKRSPETYVGFLRNQNPGIVASEQNGHTTFSRPSNPSPDRLYLVGTWDVTGEYAEAVSDDASILYTYTAKNVFLVMSAETNVTATLLRDGALLTSDLGTHAEKNGTVRVQNEQLYRLIEQTSSESHTLEIKAEPGLRAFAFTFG